MSDEQHNYDLSSLSRAELDRVISTLWDFDTMVQMLIGRGVIESGEEIDVGGLLIDTTVAQSNARSRRPCRRAAHR